LQCELALHLGRTLGELSKMTEREFGIWIAYRRLRAFPFRRLELYSAQIALKVAQSAGAQNVTLKDFLFDHDQPQQPSEADVAYMLQEMTRG
jgi:hypothetical protein